jgi:hypothetical protein
VEVITCVISSKRASVLTEITADIPMLEREQVVEMEVDSVASQVKIVDLSYVETGQLMGGDFVVEAICVI